MHPDCLEEEKGIEAAKDEEDRIGDQGPEGQFRKHDEAEAHKFVTSVGEQLKEGWRLWTARDPKEVETALEDCSLQNPQEETLSEDVTEDIRGEPKLAMRLLSGTYSAVRPI